MKKMISLLLLCAVILSISAAALADKEKKDDPAAVSAGQERSGLPFSADDCSLRMTRSADGASCDEEMGQIPADSILIFTPDDLDRMPEEARKEFEARIEQVRQLDPELVRELFWIELTGEYADAVGEQDDGSVIELDLRLPGNGSQSLFGLLNGDNTSVTSDADGNFRLTLRETGSVIITTKAVRITDGVMAVVSEEEAEEKKVWVDSPAAGGKDPTEPARMERYADLVPVFTQEEYEIRSSAGEAGEDEQTVSVPRDAMSIVSLDQIDTLPPAAQESFLREYERLRSDTEHVVYRFFYFDLPAEYRSLIGEQEDGSVKSLLLSFTGDRDDYTVTANGNEMEVSASETEEGTFYYKCTELGSIAIVYPDEGELQSE